MARKKPDSPQSGKTPKKSYDIFYVITGVLIVLLIFIFFFWHQSNFGSFNNNEKLLDSALTEDISVPGKDHKSDIENSSAAQSFTLHVDSPETPDPLKSQASLTNKTAPARDNINHINPATAAYNKSPDKTIAELALPGNTQDNPPLLGMCDISSRTIINFYNHLDKQDYIKVFGLHDSCEDHFTKLIQRLLDNPPVVSGEMNDLFTILQNTAHFFRIIGKDNILVLKGILDREKSNFEYVLADFFKLLHIPGCAKKTFSLNVSRKALYDYAGFFLNTMGGRLYLFRRDSMSRMVVSYYAVLLIDRANKNAANEHGIDIIAHIDQLIDEIESTSNPLLLKDDYLDKLYSLKEEYQ